MACGECRLPYPDDMLSPLMTNGGYSQPVCGICALAMVNASHGTHNKRFHGELAEDDRQRALNWRRKHPNVQAEGR